MLFLKVLELALSTKEVVQKLLEGSSVFHWKEGQTYQGMRKKMYGKNQSSLK